MWLLDSIETGDPSCQPLSWNLRISAALDVAKALAYLHSPEANVIFRDPKTSNIVMDYVCGTM